MQRYGALQCNSKLLQVAAAEGHTAREIAANLTITSKTVEFHRENIKRKLALNTTAELTRHAIELGLV